jgi:hypothetical protein
MKLIFVHIPKTAGSSIHKFLQQGGEGVWLKHGQLEESGPSYIWNLDYLAGHFTQRAVLTWVKKNRLSLHNVKFLTLIRHPMEQLQSNLSFPFELEARGDNACHEIPWMNDILSLDPNSSSDLTKIISKYPWLLNMQWQYLVSGTSGLDEAVKLMDHIAIFPDVDSTLGKIGQILNIQAPKKSVHENASRQKFIKKSVFAEPKFREMLLRDNGHDIQLFIEIIKRRMSESGLQVLSKICKLEPETIYDDWLNA